MPDTNFDEAFARLREGRMIVMVPDRDDDAEGDIVMAAENITADDVNFMAAEGRGIVSVALGEKRLRELAIPLAANLQNGYLAEQASSLIEAREGVTTGISAADRARTIQVAANPKCGPDDIVMPGHVLPLVALSGGVMMRGGRAEGAVDIVRCAGMGNSAALCGILTESGEAATLPELRGFAKRHDMPIVFIRDIVSHRLTHEVLVQRAAEEPFAIRDG